MRWLYFVLSAICFAVPFRTTSLGLGWLFLGLALLFLLAGVFALASHRIQSRARDEVQILDPAELRRLREEAQRKRAEPAAAAPGSPAPSSTPPLSTPPSATPPRAAADDASPG